VRTVVIGGSTLLLLLIGAAFVGHRRSPDAVAPPASLTGPDPPGGLAFERTEVDLGAVAAGEARRVEVPWRRTGEGPLGIRNVETGCGCLLASGLPRALPAGAAGTLVLDIAGRRAPGPFSLVVRVLSDRPPDDLHHLRVRGFVGSDTVVSPAALPLAALSPGRTVERLVTVRPPPGRERTPVEARLFGLLGETRVVEGPLIRATGGGKEPEGTVRGHDVIVVVRAPETAGPFAGHVEVRVGDEGLWRVPVRGTVVAARSPSMPAAAIPAAEAPAAAGGVDGSGTGAGGLEGRSK